MTVVYDGKNPDHIDTVAQYIRDGYAVAVPTETVYGLAADATQADAVASIYSIKNRPAGHPLILHLSGVNQLQNWAVNIPEVAFQLAQRYWPGPLTLVLQKAPRVLDAVTGGHGTIAVRVPNHPVLLALLTELGTGLVAPSANPHLMLSPTSATHVYTHLAGRIPAILDGGPCTVGIESTILSVVDPMHPLILREGPITASELSTFLGVPVVKNGDPTVASPGNMARHYQPHTPLLIRSTHQIKAELDRVIQDSIGLVSITDFGMGDRSNWVRLPDTADGYAAGLYAALHQLDGVLQGNGHIWLEAPPEGWEAIWNRLARMVPLANDNPILSERARYQKD